MHFWSGTIFFFVAIVANVANVVLFSNIWEDVAGHGEQINDCNDCNELFFRSSKNAQTPTRNKSAEGRSSAPVWSADDCNLFRLILLSVSNQEAALLPLLFHFLAVELERLVKHPRGQRFNDNAIMEQHTAETFN